MSIAPPPSSADALLEKSWMNFAADLQDPKAALIVSPARYVNSLEMNIETLARNAGVTVAAVDQTPHTANIQTLLTDNLRVIKAAYDVSGNDLSRTLRWFRTEPLKAFGQSTAEQAVAAGRADHVIRFIHSLHAVPHARNLKGDWMQLVDTEASNRLELA